MSRDSTGYLVAVRPVVNVYREPSAMVEVTSQVLFGWQVQVLAEEGTWFRVLMHDGYTGWVEAACFSSDRQEADEHVLQVQGLSANLYARPDIKLQPALMQVPWESRLWGVAQEDAWWRLRLPGGATAYAPLGDMTETWSPVAFEQAVALAQRFLGVTYTWGGVSSFGYDCSGLVQMILRQRGIAIPRDAQAQAGWEGFRPVPVAEVTPGDLVFFGESESAITHVALALGEDTFLHSTMEGHPGVQYGKLADEPWRTRVCCARRLCAG